MRCCATVREFTTFIKIGKYFSVRSTAVCSTRIDTFLQFKLNKKNFFSKIHTRTFKNSPPIGNLLKIKVYGTLSMTFLSRERDRKSYVYTRTRGFYQFRSQSKNVESSVENCNFQFFQNKLKVVANSFSFSTPVVNYRHYLYRSYKQIIFGFRSRIRSWLLSLVLHHTFALIPESNKEVSMTQKKNRLSNIEASAKKKNRYSVQTDNELYKFL